MQGLFRNAMCTYKKGLLPSTVHTVDASIASWHLIIIGHTYRLLHRMRDVIKGAPVVRQSICLVCFCLRFILCLLDFWGIEDGLTKPSISNSFVRGCCDCPLFASCAMWSRDDESLPTKPFILSLLFKRSSLENPALAISKGLTFFCLIFRLFVFALVIYLYWRVSKDQILNRW